VTAKGALFDLEDAQESAALSHQFVRHKPGFLDEIRRTGPGDSVYRFKEPFRRLIADRPAPTVKIRNGGRPIHCRLHRFLFHGSKSEIEVQISNAVPPAPAEAVAASLRRAITR
jgi:site-specific DNA-cytosine methylase